MQKPPDSLRQRAEEMVRKSGEDIQQTPIKNLHAMVHELRVHQFELEIQNEELRETQLKLQDSRDRYSDLYEFAPIGYLLLDAEGVIQEANLTASMMFARERSALTGTKFAKHVAPEEQDKLYHAFRELRRSDQPTTFELRILKGGRSVWAQFSGESRKSNPNKWFVTLNDIDARKRSEELFRKQEVELARVDRMNCMDQILGGIAHEIAQPLFAIQNFAAACEIKLKQGGTDQTDLIDMNRMTVEQAVYAGEILKRLRAFSEPAKTDHEEFNINDAISDSVALTKSQSHAFQVRVIANLAEDLPKAIGDRIQIQQVVVNLLLNAFEAVSEEPVTERIVHVRSLTTEEGIEVAVEDHGEGLSSELQTKVFEAFFTTKSTGVGLGLAISRSIIEAHHGAIWVTSDARDGTIFHFNLPPLEPSEKQLPHAQ